MAKYNYDKTCLKGLGVGPFLKEVKVREAKIAEADTTPPKSIFNSNVLASKLHPHYQKAKISKVIDRGVAKEFVLEGDLAYFRAGQYVSVLFENTMRPYTICSAPNQKSYSFVIKPVENGLISNYIYENWKEGTEVIMSAPLGHFFYTDIRDAKNVVAVAGGGGITPFYSMAKAIEEQIEDFNLTIIYGSKTKDEILLKDELDEICKNTDKVKVFHVLSDEKVKGYDHGFITADIISKYAPDVDYSLYASGPPVMYFALGEAVHKLGLPLRRVRFEVPGENFNTDMLDLEDKTHKAKVYIRDEVKEVEINELETIARGLERNNIRVNTDCRSGKCGFCRSRLISGDIELQKTNFRRAADVKFNWIHPCCTYAKSDIEIEIFPIV